MQQCKSCLEIKDRSEFRYRKKRNKVDYYYQSMCKVCERKRAKELWYLNHDTNKEKLRSKIRTIMYKITEEQYQDMLLLQNNSCAICGAHTAGGKGSWHVDHNHTTNKVRGLLCHKCNTGLGLFSDNPDLLTKAREYLLEHN